MIFIDEPMGLLAKDDRVSDILGRNLKRVLSEWKKCCIIFYLISNQINECCKNMLHSIMENVAFQ